MFLYISLMFSLAFTKILVLLKLGPEILHEGLAPVMACFGLLLDDLGQVKVTENIFSHILDALALVLAHWQHFMGDWLPCC